MVSEAVLRARWIEAESIHLKRMGLSFDAISEQITRVGCGQAHPIVAVPEGVKFGPDYTISRQACHKAFRKAIAREPSLAVDELRKLDSQDDHNVEQPKRRGRHHEHSDCGDTSGLVAKEAPPGRRRRTSSSHHVLGDRGLADLDAELEDLTMDSGRSPERVGGVHLPNWITSLAIH